MKLLLLHPHDVRYFPWTIRIIKIAEELTKRGHEVTLVHPVLPQWELDEFPRKVIFTVPEDAPYRVIRLKERNRHLIANLRTVMDLARGVDLIHVQKCYPNVVVPALVSAWRWNLPVHYDWDDHEEAIVIRVPGIARGFGRLTRFYERKLPKYVDTISTASLEIRRMAVERGADPSRIVDAPVGADLEVYSPENDGSSVRSNPEFPIGDRSLVVYLGQLEGSAYAELFIDAARMVGTKHPEARFLVVGGGTLLKRLQKIVKQGNLGKTIRLTGYVNREEVPTYLAAADVAVACFEDNEITRCKSPLKIAEYMAAGKAIVAGNVGEVPRMLGNSGILTRPGDSVSLAEGIIRYIENPNLRREHAKTSRLRAEETYNWQRTTENIETAYRMALAGR